MPLSLGEKIHLLEEGTHNINSKMKGELNNIIWYCCLTVILSKIQSNVHHPTSNLSVSSIKEDKPITIQIPTFIVLEQCYHAARIINANTSIEREMNSSGDEMDWLRWKIMNNQPSYIGKAKENEGHRRGDVSHSYVRLRRNNSTTWQLYV